MSRQVIVTGGRYYDDFAMVADVLDFLRPTLVIQGGADGADRLAREWCNSTGVRCETVDAEWGKYGKAAGPMRNGAMLDAFPDALVVAFPGGKGTEDCVRKAVGLNRIVLRVEQ